MSQERSGLISTCVSPWNRPLAGKPRRLINSKSDLRLAGQGTRLLERSDALSLSQMLKVLLVTDSAWVRNEVHAALSQPNTEVVSVADGSAAAEAEAEHHPQVALVDMQVGNMGGMAITRLLHQSAALEARPLLPVVLLLDRRADAFLAKRAGAQAWVQKPIEAHQLRTAIAAVAETHQVAATTLPDIGT